MFVARAPAANSSVANAMFVSAVAEGAPHFIFGQFVTYRRHDLALVDR
jgi:hypothetical protein